MNEQSLDEKRLYYVKAEINRTIQNAALFGQSINSINGFSAADFANMLDELIVMRIKQALESTTKHNTSKE